MKLSVYVPDDLWEMVKICYPDQRPSHIIQEALAKHIPEDRFWQLKREYALRMLQEANEALGIETE